MPCICVAGDAIGGSSAEADSSEYDDEESDSSESYDDEVLPQVTGFCVRGFSIAVDVAFE